MKAAAVLGFCLTALAAWGQTEVRGTPGFVGLVRVDGAWYFSSPEGQPFLSRGVDVVLPFDTAAKPGAPRYDALQAGQSLEQWARSTADQLASWNFDTVANWSHPALNGQGLYTVETIYARIEKNKALVDVFSPEFESDARAQARRICAPRAQDRRLIGYFLENEQPWYGDFAWPTGHEPTFLDRYMELPPHAPGKRAAVEYFRRAYADVGTFNATYGTTLKSWEDLAKVAGLRARARVMDSDRKGFLAEAADRYYRVVTSAIREADPHHLILGDRFANMAPREVIAACGKWSDVVSLNYYAGFLKVNPEFLRAFADLSGRPVLITEFSWRATENRSGLKNTIGATVTVPTQRDRAEHYQRYVTELARLPFIVGYHWFQYFDESPWGRSFDGEDSNYGLVDIEGRPYELLTASAAEANAAVEAVHASSGSTVIGPPSLGDEPVHIRRGTPALAPRSFAGSSPQAWGWGDGAHGGSMSPSRGGSAVSARYATGSGWGCGLSLVPDPTWAPRGYADISGFRQAELVITAPRGLRFTVLLSEQGAADSWSTQFEGADGSDGESFASEEFTATGAEQTVVIGFDELTLRQYGNQSGNRTIDLQAVREIDLAVGGNQGSGTLNIQSLRLLP